MLLRLPLSELKPSGDLEDKLQRLHQQATIERIFTEVQVLNAEKEIIFEFDGLIDTGATVSLLPGFVLPELGSTTIEPHSLWGILDKEECKISVDLATAFIRLVDKEGNVSPIFKPVIAFSRTKKVPILIGMKGLLAQVTYHYYKAKKEFIIEFED